MNDRAQQIKERIQADGTLTERLQKCRKMVGDMCAERRPPRMSIPVRWEDEDYYIAQTIEDAIAALQQLSEPGVQDEG